MGHDRGVQLRMRHHTTHLWHHIVVGVVLGVVVNVIQVRLATHYTTSIVTYSNHCGHSPTRS